MDLAILNYLSKQEAINTYLTQNNAANTYLTQSDAINTYLTQNNAASIYPTKTGLGASGTWGINITGNAATATISQTAYGFQKAPNGFTFDADTTSRTLSIQITTHGRPVLLICSGDLNPTTADAAWFITILQRGSTELARQIAESHGNSWNIPFCITYLDIVSAGTYTYNALFSRGAGTFSLTEGGQVQSPNFVAVEI